MAFDYGTRRIGVAVGHPHLGRGHGVGVVPVRNGQPNLPTLKKLIADWQPGAFVLGMPRTRDTSYSLLQREIVQFGNSLAREYGVSVSYVDETLSTEESNFRMRQTKRQLPKSKKTNARNKLSAEIILETYFAQQPH